MLPYIRWSSSGVSYRLQRFSLNLVNILSRFSLYLSFSAEREWFSRLVLFICLSTHREFQPIVPGCMCEWFHCNSIKGFGIQNEYDTCCIWYSFLLVLQPCHTDVIHNKGLEHYLLPFPPLTLLSNHVGRITISSPHA